MGLSADTDDDLSERSRKFYDGTYKWDSQGFTDEVGVYRHFDCSDPLARAPTPLPPMFLGDEEEEAATGSHDLGYTAGLRFRKSAQVPPTESPLPPSEAVDGLAKTESRLGGLDASTAADDSIHDGQPVAALKGDDLVGHSDKDQHLQSTKTEDSKRDLTPPESPKPEKASAKSKKSPAAREPKTPPSRTKTKANSRRGNGDSDSDFSDFPSDLSSGKTKSTSASKSKRRTPAATSTDSPSQRKPPTTRGVAQKVVRKPTKKASAAPALLNMQKKEQKKEQSPPKTDTPWLRRSTRQTRNSGSGF